MVQRRIPARPRRELERVLVRLGVGLDARRAQGDGPGRVLLRVDEFPHYKAWDEPQRYGTERFAEFHDIMRDSGVPYLLAIVPRVPREALDPDETAWRPHDAGERAMLERLRADGVSFATHGLDHRTRDADPRHHSELCGLTPDEVRERVATADAELGFEPSVFVAPYNRFDAGHLPVLAERYRIVTGGPESVRLLGFQPSPCRLDGATYLPAYPPLYGTAEQVVSGLDAGIRGWAPVVLHWGWEADAGFAALRRLVDRLARLARPWDELLAEAAP